MSASMWAALTLIAVVLVGAWLLRRMSSGSSNTASGPGTDSSDPVDRVLADAMKNAGGLETPAGRRAPDREEDEEYEHVEEDEDGEHARQVVALTSDGWAFVPSGEEVELIPPGDDEPEGLGGATSGDEAPSHDAILGRIGGRSAPINPNTGRPLTSWKPGTHLDVGDLIASRVKRGAPDHDPWRLEALGRDHEFRAWRFETEESARAAHDLIAARIVRPEIDRDGELVRITDADFDEARRIEEETEAELQNEMGLDDEPRDDERR